MPVKHQAAWAGLALHDADGLGVGQVVPLAADAGDEGGLGTLGADVGEGGRAVSEART